MTTCLILCFFFCCCCQNSPYLSRYGLQWTPNGVLRYLVHLLAVVSSCPFKSCKLWVEASMNWTYTIWLELLAVTTKYLSHYIVYKCLRPSTHYSNPCPSAEMWKLPKNISVWFRFSVIKRVKLSVFHFSSWQSAESITLFSQSSAFFTL